MIEPYSSLSTVFLGCLIAVLVVTVATPFIRLIPGLEGSRWWLTGTHLLAWLVAFGTLVVSVNSSKPGDAGMLGAAIFCWFVAGMAFLLMVATGTREEQYYRHRYEQQEPPSRWAYYLWSMGGFVALMFSMGMVSATSTDKGDQPASVEYSISADGSVTPAGVEKHPLVQNESGQWVNTSWERRFGSKNDNQRTVYTWTEKRKSDASDALTVTTTVTTNIDENDISVVNDVKPSETPYAEYTPMYYLAPAGLFDDARPNPEQDKLCVLGRDTGCKANAKPSHNKIVLHLPEVEK